MTLGWKQAIEEEWERRSPGRQPAAAFPLVARSFDSEEIVAAVDVLLSGQITMGARVQEFESRFAESVGAPFAVMVNSGSSANLLALAVLCNPARTPHLRPGDEVLVPAVCWSTSVWPILQMGLKPVFVDVDAQTLNVRVDDVKAKLTDKMRAMVAVHVLGNSAPMADLLPLLHEHSLLLVEDTCEALGSRAGNRALGTWGDFGTYSFYFSHHITTGEGGMVVCRTPEDYDLLKCLRAHGWSRELSDRDQQEQANPEVDSRFLFVNVGYNLRPMEIQAAFGLCQLNRLAGMNRTRNANRDALIAALQCHPRWRNQLEFPDAAPGTDPAWFGFPAMLAPRCGDQQQKYFAYLNERGVENRPIISGNFTRQPALRLFGIAPDPSDFPGAEQINARGFFVGLHPVPLGEAKTQELADILLGYEFAGYE